MKALRAATKAARYVKEAERQRIARAAIKADPRYFPENVRNVGAVALAKSIEAGIRQAQAARASKEAERLRRAALKAETRRILRNGRPYDPATDPIKQMIRARQDHYKARRLRAGPMVSAPPEIAETSQVDPDYLRLLEAIRDQHRREAKEPRGE
ncbi:hypothetical protein [Variovorax sp. PBL-E5]|uniref:hypothetical protein n=1 Tax=Variovorax sp. PBL-E5 TaxID=434014 RepID=UPI0013A59333|nr:hypothetical protein [Variovorax sp. PBL-E5]